ncbi:MAG: NAD-dependent succinate-semialdehyde dehydrogenase [Sphingomonadales bacterium]
MTIKHQLFIDGRWRDGGGEAITVTDPATGQVIARQCMADVQDMDDALAAAARGFKAWRALPVAQRAAYLHDVAKSLRARAEVIGHDLSAEQGKPLAQAKGEVMATAGYFDDLARSALYIFDRVTPAEAGGVVRTIVHEPIGPVFAVSPWNLPAMMPGRKIANSLAAGCSVIVKPAKETPGTAAHLAQACADAGIPAGVVNILCGPSDAMSRHMIASAVVRKVSFTGSTEVGKELAALAGASMKKVTMELGGHAPVILCADADLDKAVPMLASSRHANAGQSCMAPTRFFVAEPIYELFCTRFSEAARALKLGHGLNADTDMGPLASQRRLPVMEHLSDDALSKGARLMAGGARHGNQGYFYQPTVLADMPEDAAIMQEEPFGPITAITSFADLDDVIARANATPYGLASYIFSRDIGVAREIALGLEAGLVGINSVNVAAPSVPFGGVKDSGIGREGSFEGLLESMVTKTISAGAA